MSAIAGLLRSAIDATVEYMSRTAVEYLIKTSIEFSVGISMLQSQLITSLWHFEQIDK